MGRKVDRADKCEGCAGALQQAAHLRRPFYAEAEHDAPDGEKDDPKRNGVFGPPPIERSTRDERERRISVIVDAEQRAHPESRQAERSRQLRDHHPRRGTHRVLHEIEQQTKNHATTKAT